MFGLFLNHRVIVWLQKSCINCFQDVFMLFLRSFWSLKAPATIVAKEHGKMFSFLCFAERFGKTWGWVKAARMFRIPLTQRHMVLLWPSWNVFLKFISVCCFRTTPCTSAKSTAPAAFRQSFWALSCFALLRAQIHPIRAASFFSGREHCVPLAVSTGKAHRLCADADLSMQRSHMCWSRYLCFERWCV